MLYFDEIDVTSAANDLFFLKCFEKQTPI